MKKLCFLFVVLFFLVIQQANGQFGDKAIAQFDLTVPASFNHDTQIDVSAEKAKKQKDTYFYNPDLTSENFSKVKIKLIPGEIYLVELFPITENVSSQQCLSYLKNQKALLVGSQGLTLIYDLAKDKLPKDKWIISFASKEELQIGSTGSYVPYIQTYSEGDYAFRLSDFTYDWILKGLVLVCVTKKG